MELKELKRLGIFCNLVSEVNRYYDINFGEIPHF